jgi:sialate O-acetylesterase
MKRTSIFKFTFLFVVLFFSFTKTNASTKAELQFAAIFSDNMVLQQNCKSPVWGTGNVGESITVTTGWGQSATAIVDETGKWFTKIQTPIAVKGNKQELYTLTAKSVSGSKAISNILIGDVYLCSGQSNMAYRMNRVPNLQTFALDISTANYPNLRYNSVGKNRNLTPQKDINSDGWSLCTPETAGSYSAVAFYFARELYNNPDINIPIGIINASVGGTSCQSWISREALAANTELKLNILDPFDLNPDTKSNKASTTLFNGMIYPIIPFAIKGILWYQGEANFKPETYSNYYTTLLSTLISDWRNRWNQGDIPFLYVQLPAFKNTSPAFRDQQTNVLKLNATGMAVTLDLGEVDSIHPCRKFDVAKRLVKIALAKVYNKNITYSGPTFESMSVEGDKIRVKFQEATLGSGLAARDGSQTLNSFKIAGSNGVFYDAEAYIDGNGVIVSSQNVVKPSKVSYAYFNSVFPNLMNKDSLTACPFNTDTWNNDIVIKSIVSKNQELKSTKIKITKNKNKIVVSGFNKPDQMRIVNSIGKTFNYYPQNKNSIEIEFKQHGIYIVQCGDFISKIII